MEESEEEMSCGLTRRFLPAINPYSIRLVGSGTNVRLNVGDNFKLSPTLELIRVLHL